MRCVECEHFHNRYRPLRTDGVIWDSGFAECDKYDMCIDYLSTRQLNRLECVEENENGKNNIGNV